MSKVVPHPFIGMGNPESNVLFVGQTCAVNPGTPRANAEIVENWQEWNELVNGLSPLGDRVFFDSAYGCDVKHNPLVGQQYKQNGTFVDLVKSPRRILKSGCHGIGNTWYNYSKILESSLNKAYLYDKGCSFFDDCFMTELSVCCATSNGKTNSKQTRKSVTNRCGGILQNPFFQKFGVVVIAAGRYDQKYGVQYTNVFPNDGSRIIILTPQLSRMSNDLKDQIVDTIKKGVPGVCDLRGKNHNTCSVN